MSRRMKNSDKIICTNQKIKLPIQARSVLRTLNLLHDAAASKDVLMQSVRCVFQKDFARKFEAIISEKCKNETDLMRTFVSALSTYHHTQGRGDSPQSRKRKALAWNTGSEVSPEQTKQTLLTTEPRHSTALIVSDSEDAPEVVRVPQQLAEMDYWMQLADMIHLHVVSRTSNTIGKSKTYEVFRLSSGWMTATSSLDAETLRTKLLKELHTLFWDKSSMEQGGETSSCRVYALRTGSVMWVQIHIRQPVNKTIRFNATIQGGLVALTPGSLRGKDRCFTKYVLAALDSVLCPASSSLLTADDNFIRKVKGVSGTEPVQLLKESADLERNHVTGRYRAMADGKQRTDPLQELEHAACGSLLLADNGETKSGSQMTSQLVAKTSLCSVVDHNAGAQNERKRKRITELGRDGDCPVRKKVSCDWKGETEAATACWGVASVPDGKNKTYPFQATLKLEGTDVIRGLQAMMDAGYLEQGPFSSSVCQGQQEETIVQSWGMIRYS